MRKKYKIMLLSIAVLLIGTLVLGTSYSLWTNTNHQVGINTVSVGCFSVSFTDSGFEDAGNISLDNEYPIPDSRGMAKTPYKFKIKNECSVAANYQINLETLSGSNMNTNFLKVQLNDSDTPALYASELDDAEVALGSSSLASRKVTTGYLADGQEATFTLRVWIDENASNTDGVMNTTWKGKVVVVSQATTTDYSGSEYTGENPTSLKTFSAQFMKGETRTPVAVADTLPALMTDFTSTDGAGIYRYTGATPNNYVYFDNSTWRIVGIFDGYVKIVKQESIGHYAWDTNNGNSWENSTLSAILNNSENSYYNNPLVAPYNWGTGIYMDVFIGANAGVAHYSDEIASRTTNALKVGLISGYDINVHGGWFDTILAGKGDRAVLMAISIYQDDIGDYLNVSDEPSNSAYAVTGYFNSSGITYWGVKETFDDINVNPCVYLKQGLYVVGSGTQEDPYIFTETTDPVPSNEGDKRYVGANPANYVKFNNESWRIVGIIDDKVKLVKAAPITDYTFDFVVSGYTTSPFYKTVEEVATNYYDSLADDAKALIVDNAFNIGTLSSLDKNASEVLDEEKVTTWTGKVGTINLSDYLSASSDNVCKTTVASAFGNCANTNYLYTRGNVWTMSKSSSSNYAIDGTNIVEGDTSTERGILPTVVLSDDVKVASGAGVKSNPYILTIE